MRSSYYLFLFFVCIILSNQSHGQKSLRISPDNGGQSGCDLFVANFDSIEEFTSFYQKLKVATKSGSWERVASLMNFPVQVNLKRRNYTFNDKKDVQKNYKNVFNSKLVKVIQNQNPNRVFCNAKGVMIGDGEIWITKSNGNIGINGINVF